MRCIPQDVPQELNLISTSNFKTKLFAAVLAAVGA